MRGVGHHRTRFGSVPMIPVQSGHADTIVALSTGQGRAALAIVRLSGPHVRFVIETMLNRSLVPRAATLVTFRNGTAGALIDRCVAVFFEAPGSATGEDVLELHLHGSRAVVEAALRAITACHSSIRLAEPGEFTRRALERGKMGLLEVEALGELLEAETPLQLAQAQRQLSGVLHRKVASWRDAITELQALIEADLDFSDEGDVGDDLVAMVRPGASAVASSVREVLGQAKRGARVKDGASIVISGAPNAGKSMLINALTRRDLAIVSDRPGTTRDVLECPGVIDGWPVVFIDTAGLRESWDPVEQEGIRRAEARIAEADIVLSVFSHDVPVIDLNYGVDTVVIPVMSKSDVHHQRPPEVCVVSGVTGEGIPSLLAAIASVLRANYGGEPALVSRERQRLALEACLLALERAGSSREAELVAEDLRLAQTALGRLTGHVDVESVLDRLFAGFCIGK